MNSSQHGIAAVLSLCIAGAAFGAVASTDTQRISINEYELSIQQASNLYAKEEFDAAFAGFQKTARWGDKYSQYVLGTMYVMGLGTPIDNVEGYAWLAAAAESKKEKYQETADQVINALNTETRKAAQELADHYISRYGMKAMKVNCSRRKSTGSNRMIRTCRRSHSLGQTHYEIPVYADDDGNRLAGG